jgi:hypothetical protein
MEVEMCGKILQTGQPPKFAVACGNHLPKSIQIAAALYSGGAMLRQENNWNPRPRALREFPPDTQVRLRQLDFNRTITIYVGSKELYVRRTALDKFQWCEAACPTSDEKTIEAA